MGFSATVIPPFFEIPKVPASPKRYPARRPHFFSFIMGLKAKIKGFFKRKYQKLRSRTTSLDGSDTEHSGPHHSEQHENESNAGMAGLGPHRTENQEPTASRTRNAASSGDLKKVKAPEPNIGETGSRQQFGYGNEVQVTKQTDRPKEEKGHSANRFETPSGKAKGRLELTLNKQAKLPRGTRPITTNNSRLLRSDTIPTLSRFQREFLKLHETEFLAGCRYRTCSQFRKPFVHIEQWHAHLEQQHNNQFHCTQCFWSGGGDCGVMFKYDAESIPRFVQHLLDETAHAGPARFGCLACRRRFPTESDQRKHMKENCGPFLLCC